MSVARICCSPANEWNPIQVNQNEKVGRLDIDSFEGVMLREARQKGFIVAFDDTGDALREMAAFVRKAGEVVVSLTVREIRDREPAKRPT